MRKKIGKLNRFDIPESIKNLIQVAIETKTYDAISIYIAAINFGTDYNGLIEDICNTAFSNIHWNKDAHRKVVRAAEKIWNEQN